MTLESLRRRWLPILKGTPTKKQVNNYAEDVRVFKILNPKWRNQII